MSSAVGAVCLLTGVPCAGGAEGFGPAYGPAAVVGAEGCSEGGVHVLSLVVFFPPPCW